MTLRDLISAIKTHRRRSGHWRRLESSPRGCCRIVTQLAAWGLLGPLLEPARTGPTAASGPDRSLGRSVSPSPLSRPLALNPVGTVAAALTAVKFTLG